MIPRAVVVARQVAFVIVGDSDRCVELPAPDVGDENVPPAFMRRRNERQPRTVRRPSRVDIDRAVSQERAGRASREIEQPELDRIVSIGGVDNMTAIA